MTQCDDRSRAILVVDDNGSIRDMVKTFLEAAGYCMILASNGVVGLTFFERNRPAIALLLTDVEMPQMNGLDLVDRVPELDPRLPVLLMSGAASGAYRGYGCMAKPFQSSELLAQMRAALQRGSPEFDRRSDVRRVCNIDQTAPHYRS